MNEEILTERRAARRAAILDEAARLREYAQNLIVAKPDPEILEVTAALAPFPATQYVFDLVAVTDAYLPGPMPLGAITAYLNGPYVVSDTKGNTWQNGTYREALESLITTAEGGPLPVAATRREES